MRKFRSAVEMLVRGVMAFAALGLLMAQASALHACDPATDEGWRVVATEEVTGIRNGAPYPDGADWLVERVTTLLPLCSYFNATGNYSLRSYALDPHDKTERVTICRNGVPVKPYAGACPPR